MQTVLQMPTLQRLLLLQVTVPQHRMTPLKTHWMSLYEPVTQNMKLDMRMNLKSKKVRPCMLCMHVHPKPVLLWKPGAMQDKVRLSRIQMQVELKTTPETPDAAYLQKAADFVHAFILGGQQSSTDKQCEGNPIRLDRRLQTLQFGALSHRLCFLDRRL